MGFFSDFLAIFGVHHAVKKHVNSNPYAPHDIRHNHDLDVHEFHDEMADYDDYDDFEDIEEYEDSEDFDF